MIGIALLPLTFVLGHACATPPESLPGLARAEVELGDRLRATAPRTNPFVRRLEHICHYLGGRIHEGGFSQLPMRILEFVDAHISGRLADVTIDTSNFALRNLSFDCGPRQAGRHHLRYVSALIANVVELKDDHVVLTTVNTWVFAQVLPHPYPIRSCGSVSPFTRALNAFWAVRDVPLVQIFGCASAATRAPHPSEPRANCVTGFVSPQVRQTARSSIERMFS
jgi:hypothetical protein